MPPSDSGLSLRSIPSGSDRDASKSGPTSPASTRASALSTRLAILSPAQTSATPSSAASSSRSPTTPFSARSLLSPRSGAPSPTSAGTSSFGTSSHPSPISSAGTPISAGVSSSLGSASTTYSTGSSGPPTASSGSMSEGASVRSRKKAGKKGKGRVASDSGSLASTPVSASSSTTTSSNGPYQGERTQFQEAIRLGSLYLFPALLAIPLGLLIHLTTLLLTPLYNSLPLSLHPYLLYALFALPPASLYALFTLKSSAQEVISARVCLTIMAIAGDLIVVVGRRAGSLTGAMLGAEYGALAGRAVLGVGAVGGATAFALLCFDHAVPIQPGNDQSARLADAANVIARAAAYVLHVYYAEKGWAKLLGNGSSILVQHPEKTILFISLLLTALSLFVRTPMSSTASFASSTHRFLTNALSLRPGTSKKLKEATDFLPRSVSPVLLLLRLPLLILAVRQQIFLRPSPPYYAANGTTRVLHSEKSVTGQIVVAEHLTSGYRFLRCDASLLGGRWMRLLGDEKTIDLGDSIFATFGLQEVGVLAHRSDEAESLARTISMTTELQLEAEEEVPEEEKPQERALVIGLGVGISASAMAKRGMALDAVEIDPAVYHAARDYFNATLPPASTTISLLPGQDYISQVARMNQQMNGTMQKWSYVIHDCFSAGKLPAEVFALEFWRELSGMVEVDGVVAINIAGVLHSLATKRIIVTLLRAFTQCRAFGESGDEEVREDLMNIVVFCTMTHSPLLTFRPPTRFDVLRSPMRSHVYSNFHAKEISLLDIISETDLINDELLITHDGSAEGLTQVAAGLATWKNMQNLLTREMWLAW